MTFRGFNSINEWQNAISPLVDDYKNLRYDYDAKTSELNQLNLEAFKYRTKNREVFDQYALAKRASIDLFNKLYNEGIGIFIIRTDRSYGWVDVDAEAQRLYSLSEGLPEYVAILNNKQNALKEKNALNLSLNKAMQDIESVGDRNNVVGGYESYGRSADYQDELNERIKGIDTKIQEIKLEYERTTGEPYDKMTKASSASAIAVPAIIALEEEKRTMHAFRRSGPQIVVPRTTPTPQNIDRMDHEIAAMESEISALEALITTSGNKYDGQLFRSIVSGIRTDLNILSARRDIVVTEFQKLPQKPTLPGQPAKTYKTKAQQLASGEKTPKVVAAPSSSKPGGSLLAPGQKPGTVTDLPEASVDPALEPQDAISDMPLPEAQPEEQGQPWKAPEGDDVQPATQEENVVTSADSINSQLRAINEQRLGIISDYEATTGKKYTGTLMGEEGSAYAPLLRELQEKESLLWASRKAALWYVSLPETEDIEPGQEEGVGVVVVGRQPESAQLAIADPPNVILDDQQYLQFTDPRKAYSDRLSPERLASIEEAFSFVDMFKGFLSGQNIDYNEQDIQVGGVAAEPSGGELLLRDQVVIDYQPPPSQGGITIEPELTLRPTGFTVTREKQPKLKLPRGATYMAEPDYFEQVPGFKLPQGQSTQSAATPAKPDESYIKPGLATVEGRVENLIRTDNPLTQAAAAAAERKYQAKGLLQSSGAVQAGVGAAMEQAVQIATPDAALYGGLAQQRQRTDLEASVNNQLADIERKKFENNALITASLASQDISAKKDLQTLADTAAKERLQLENEWKDYLSQSQYDTAETQALMQSAGAMGQELTGSIERLLRDTNIVNKQDAIAALMTQYKAQLNTVAATAGITLEWS